ncbi:MAG TPA: FxDxF family PEP-CTERM protein [Burkholderiales bacterium]|nr:FxDxF family PEP-CTERM protein [Burkholderiales bacterium]
MKLKLLKTAAVAALMFTSLAANADNFNFSYIFGDSQVVTGSFSGNLVGSFINDISNIQVSLNGTPFLTDGSGSLYAAGWDPVALNYDSAPVVSTDASLNNFIFADSNVPTDFGASNYFTFTNDSTYGSLAFAVNTNTGGIALDNPTNGSWSVTVAAVPEPESYAMLMAGLGLVGVIARRRRSV